MDDLISRQAAIDAILKIHDYGNSDRANALGLAECALTTLPSAQPEIIRCRNCKHYYFADNRIPQEQRFTCDLDGDRWTADSYCSFAERREE